MSRVHGERERESNAGSTKMANEHLTRYKFRKKSRPLRVSIADYTLVA